MHCACVSQPRGRADLMAEVSVRLSLLPWVKRESCSLPQGCLLVGSLFLLGKELSLGGGLGLCTGAAAPFVLKRRRVTRGSLFLPGRRLRWRPDFVRHRRRRSLRRLSERLTLVDPFAKIMLKLRLLTWDVKDTLLRLRIPVGESYAAEAQAHGLQVPSEVLDQSFQRAYKTQNLQFPNYGLNRGLSSKQWWLDVVMETFRLSGTHDYVVLKIIAENLYQDYSSASNWEILPGATKTLQWCGHLGIRMAVISNFDRRLQEILSQCGLRQYFEFILCSEEVGFAKPDKRIFLEALRISGVPPQLAAHVGDHYTKDYRAAREAGMHSFLLRRNGQVREGEVPEKHLLLSLMGLLPLIQKAEG
uniref:Haloacid dehalogenase-like hydrolase domain-containing protein 3 n=1 Tax=Salvator merianae TaxID=96440 RepID=A0A8D0BIW0_SALMN